MQKVSIIVPVYNVERYINRCINSILVQTYTEFELILIDDGSPDNCGEICEAFARMDERVCCIHQKNIGLSGARNSGLDKATGNYICFVDSDDAVHEDFLRTLVETIESHNADIASCGRVDVYDESLPKGEAIINYTIEFNQHEAMRHLVENKVFYQTVWDKIYTRKAIGNIRFPVGKLHEDEFFTWKVLLNSEKIITVDAPLYYYYHRSGSIMESFSARRMDFLAARDERHAHILRHFPELSLCSKESIEFPCILFMQKLLQTRNKDLINSCIPTLQYYYKKNKLSFEEIQQIPLKVRVWYFLANFSLRQSAALRIFFNRLS